MIPFVDLRSQYSGIKAEIHAAISHILESTQFVLGEEVERFEREFAAMHQAEFGIAVNSGTSALHLALLGAGVGPGDEVITVPFTFVATAAAIGYTGARPVFVDIDPETFTMDVNKLARAITPKTKAIIPVHLYGHPADMDPILDIAAEHGIAVIEDACQAHNSVYKGRPVGGLGRAGCFSFYPGKNLGAYGEGGIVTTNDPNMARQARMLRDWGAEKKYHHVLKGFNYRMEGLQGAILRVKLKYLAGWTDARRHHAQAYDDALRHSGVVTPTEASWARHVYHVYAVRCADRDGLQKTLQSNGIGSGIHYPIPVHLQPCWAELGHKPGDFPESEKAAKEVLSLPMFPELSDTEIEMVAAAIKQEALVV
jgi:dTDP-4-amino-4,6-dideoxygalactose transaminase